MLTVRDLLKSKKDGIWAVSPETSVIDALRFMTAKGIGALMVLEDGLLSGIISERDFVHQIAENRSLNLDLPIREYMTTKVITVAPENTIQECMQIMTNRRIRHLPVINKGELVGLISIGDVVKGIISDQTDLIDNLEKYITGTGYVR
jgi:CBS domain-containing protein